MFLLQEHKQREGKVGREACFGRAAVRRGKEPRKTKVVQGRLQLFLFKIGGAPVCVRTELLLCPTVLSALSAPSSQQPNFHHSGQQAKNKDLKQSTKGPPVQLVWCRRRGRSFVLSCPGCEVPECQQHSE